MMIHISLKDVTGIPKTEGHSWELKQSELCYYAGFLDVLVSNFDMMLHYVRFQVIDNKKK